MTANSPIKLDKAKELAHILQRVKKASTLLNEADYNAAELCNRDLLDHKQASAVSTYFDRAMATVHELDNYLESLNNG